MDLGDQTMATAVALGLTQVATGAGMPSRFAALASVGFGACVMLAQMGVSGDAALAGVIAGLSASGLYSGVKSAAQSRKVHS